MKPGKTAPTWFPPEKNHQVQARSPFSWFNYGKLRLVYRTPRWPVWVCLNHFFPGWAVGPPQKNIKKYEGQLGYETCTFFSLVARCRIHCAILTSKSAPRLSAVNAFKFEMCFAPQRRALFETQLPKVLRTWCVLHQVRFRNLFPPQRRALFQHLNFQKCSEPGVSCTFWLGHVLRATTQHLSFQKRSEAEVLCTFWLRNLLRATTERTFSTSQLPKVVREWCALYILTSKCASRHNAFEHLSFQKRSEAEVLCTFWLRNLLRATTERTFSTSQLPKVVREWCALYILTSKCASRHNAFEHLSFQKRSEAEVLCTFWLRNLLRATTERTFSTSQLPKVVREWCALYILTSKCASRHNGVQLFISHLASWLRTRCFSEPTFGPSGASNH